MALLHLDKSLTVSANAGDVNNSLAASANTGDVNNSLASNRGGDNSLAVDGAITTPHHHQEDQHLPMLEE